MKSFEIIWNHMESWEIIWDPVGCTLSLCGPWRLLARWATWALRGSPRRSLGECETHGLSPRISHKGFPGGMPQGISHGIHQGSPRGSPSVSDSAGSVDPLGYLPGGSYTSQAQMKPTYWICAVLSLLLHSHFGTRPIARRAHARASAAWCLGKTS